MSKSDRIREDIDRTRREMDETLDEVEDRMQPRHLLDDVLDLVRSDGGGGGQAKRIGKTLARQVKENPAPALLCGAGLVWMALEAADEDEGNGRARRDGWRDLPEHSGSYVDARTGEPYVVACVAAWDEEYDWTDEDEQSWMESARATVADVQKTLADQSASTKDRLRTAADRLRKLRGRKLEESLGDWRDLEEHSGSFVDARTGEPYDETYGGAALLARDLDVLAEREWDEESERRWSEKANRALDRVRRNLSDTRRGVKSRVSGAVSELGDFAGTMQGRAARQGHRARRGAGRAGRGAKRAGEAARRRGGELAHRTGDWTAETVDQYPLAVGAACLGLGLLVGLAIPSTRREDELMGDVADDLKGTAAGKGREAMSRGRRVARETGEAALDEAERQGLTPERMADKAREKAERVADTAREEAPDPERVRGKVERVAEEAAGTAKSRSKEEAEAIRK